MLHYYIIASANKYSQFLLDQRVELHYTTELYILLESILQLEQPKILRPSNGRLASPSKMAALKGLFFIAYQNLVGRCLVCKHDNHVIKIPKADWSSVKNKQLTATPC